MRSSRRSKTVFDHELGEIPLITPEMSLDDKQEAYRVINERIKQLNYYTEEELEKPIDPDVLEYLADRLKKIEKGLVR
jgi:hypothetical protein